MNTHRGLFRYNRMVFGIAPAPAVWPRTMDKVLAGIPGTQCLLDDMLVTGKSEVERKKNVEAVLQRLMEYGLKVNLDKWEFMQDRLEFCAHVTNKNGLHTTDEKVKALQDAPTPQNVTQLRSYLGLLNYYNRFLPNLAPVLYPLHRLLESKRQWRWMVACASAFRKSKELVRSSRLLVHYDLEKPVSVACDASPYGLVAVLSHSMPDGTDRPVAFASRSLTAAEFFFLKEALAIVRAVKKFHIYIYIYIYQTTGWVALNLNLQHFFFSCTEWWMKVVIDMECSFFVNIYNIIYIYIYIISRPFTLLTDHKPLLTIFNPQKGISITTAARLQRYALTLGAYQYQIQYRLNALHANADAFSRLPLKLDSQLPTTERSRIVFCDAITAKEIAQETNKDSVLREILMYRKVGH
uniref:ribonuclease H n=1 Tax=Leptobrachium leishanense TaxID=445787 RepID=A0A8C5PH91_9ANUR